MTAAGDLPIAAHTHQLAARVRRISRLASTAPSQYPEALVSRAPGGLRDRAGREGTWSSGRAHNRAASVHHLQRIAISDCAASAVLVKATSDDDPLAAAQRIDRRTPVSDRLGVSLPLQIVGR